MTFPYTQQCTDSCELFLEPVPGATHWPRRLVCKNHGYPKDRTYSAISSESEQEHPNVYTSEIASPADVREVGGKEVSQY
jgi:hypothetical protein